MASLDSLAADQRAVLQLVLQRGRSYEAIAGLLSIDRADVRQRALAALDALGPETPVEPQRRALITDYLLGQLPPRVGEDTRDHLARSADERAWARVVASELAPLSSRPLPEILADGPGQEAVSDRAAPAGSEEPAPARAEEPSSPAEGRPRTKPTPPEQRTPSATAPPAAPRTEERARARTEEPSRARGPQRAALTSPARGPSEAVAAEPHPSSRRGGSVLLALGALVVVIVVVIVIATGGSSPKHSSSAAGTATTPPASTSSSTSSTSTASSTSTGGATHVLAKFNMLSPTSGSKTTGVADVVRHGTMTLIAVIAQGVPANTLHNAYGVWLSNSRPDSHFLGFLNGRIGADGRVSLGFELPANARRYMRLLLTLETHQNPSGPGKIVLQGTLHGVP